MFTGLVEERGTVVSVHKRGKSVLLTLKGRKTTSGIRVDDSICVNGVCLTVVRRRKGSVDVQAVEETLKKTTIGLLGIGSSVNLERALRANGRLGGHFVLGHADGVGRVEEILKRRNSWMIWIAVPSRFRASLIPVGSIAVNGVSLTIADLRGSRFAVSIIPHTWDVTTMKFLKAGDRVNVEFDVIGKYVERFLSTRSQRKKK